MSVIQDLGRFNRIRPESDQFTSNENNGQIQSAIAQQKK